MRVSQLLCWAVCLTLLSMPSLACDQPQELIYVTGESHMALTPDYTEWVVDTQVRSDTAKSVVASDEAMIKALRAAIKDADVDEADVLVSVPRFTQDFGEEHKWVEGARVIRYTVERRVVFTLKDFEEIPDLFVALAEMKVEFSCTYKSSRYDETVKQAKAAALEQAKEQAMEQAAVLGQKIGPAKSVRVEIGEQPSQSGFFGIKTEGLTAALGAYEDEGYDPEAAGADGRVHVKAYANVDFELKP